MEKRKQQDGKEAGERAHDELKLPEDRVEDLEPEKEQSADVKGGAVDMFLKIEN